MMRRRCGHPLRPVLRGRGPAPLPPPGCAPGPTPQPPVGCTRSTGSLPPVACTRGPTPLPPALRARGLTLLELVIVIAMVALVASLALPNFGAAAERTRLKAAAETLAADLLEARFEAAQRGSALHVAFGGGRHDWCWAVASQPDCDCAAPAACQLKAVRGRDHAGIELLRPVPALLGPGGTPLLPAGAELRSSRGESLRVVLSVLGRVRVCSAGTGAAVAGYAAC